MVEHPTGNWEVPGSFPSLVAHFSSLASFLFCSLIEWKCSEPWYFYKRLFTVLLVWIFEGFGTQEILASHGNLSTAHVF